jgi:hypothetical protein
LTLSAVFGLILCLKPQAPSKGQTHQARQQWPKQSMGLGTASLDNATSNPIWSHCFLWSLPS